MCRHAFHNIALLVRAIVTYNLFLSLLRDVLFIVRAGSDIIKADFMHIKRTTFPTKMKTGMLLGELK